MIHILLYVSDSLGERFFVGAIDGLIIAVIYYFIRKWRNKKEKKEYVEDLKRKIYHESSAQSMASGNAIEVACYNTLYDELKEKCNPANYMNPYNAEKVEISNQIYSQLDTNKYNLSVLIELRNLAINKLGLSFSAKELFDKLCDIYNPNNYIGEKYDADKLYVANQIYAKIQKNADDIIELERIAKENGIVLKKNSEKIHETLTQVKVGLSENLEQNNENSEKTLWFFFIFVVVLIILMIISASIH